MSTRHGPYPEAQLRLPDDGAWVLRGHVRVFVPAGQWDRNEGELILAKRKPLTRADFKCGTIRGYRKHLKLGESCAACRQANATDRAERVQAKSVRQLWEHATEMYPVHGRIRTVLEGAQTPLQNLTSNTPETDKHTGANMATRHDTHTLTAPATESLVA